MEKTQRRELLRLRHRAIGGLPYQVVHKAWVDAHTAPVPNHGPGKPIAVFYGVSYCDPRPKWLNQSGQKLYRHEIRQSRKARDLALIRIAEKWGTPEWYQKQNPYCALRHVSRRVRHEQDLRQG